MNHLLNFVGENVAEALRLLTWPRCPVCESSVHVSVVDLDYDFSDPDMWFCESCDEEFLTDSFLHRIGSHVSISHPTKVINDD